MKRLPLGLLILLVTTQAPQGAEGFRLGEVADRFPSKGLEHQIEFWKLVFGKRNGREVMIHDVDDLRLVYHLEVFDRGIIGDAAEGKRQREFLLRRIKAIGEQIRGMKHKELTELNPEQRSFHKLLTTYGYPIQPDVLDRLSRNMRYQRGVADRFRDGLVRSGMYMPWIEKVFSEHRLPLELSKIPHVESSFDYNAYSKAGAAGIWQFTRGTGKNYMQIGTHIDERLDPIRATEAAAKLLSENYRDLGNWPLAITAYNHGKNGMMRAKREHGPDLLNIIRNYRSKLFGFASRNFYAEFLAALYIARNHEEYFGSVTLAPPLEFDTVDLVRSTRTSSLTEVDGVSQADLLHLNPHLRRFVASGGSRIPAGIEIRVPKGRGQAVLASLQGAGDAAGRQQALAAPGERHTVRSGETLASIAARYGTSVAELQRLNSLRNPNLVHPGQRLLLRRAEDRIPSGTEVAASNSTGRYQVRRGDTLSSIARRHKTTVDQLLRLNRMNDPNLLRPGQQLVVPAD